MTKREAAIVSAYTGIMLGHFSDLQDYTEKLLQRPVWTHQFANKKIVNEIKNKSKQDFCSISVSG
ncbi:hypothetical protein LCGC14_0403920 [marine sediment metagenome]|uniref:DUF7736 domain-containing protein n=1 Tax=marine sediment metagenome TaxID=412755 RepID=A0A0F9W4V6_9ZZZZ